MMSTLVLLADLFPCMQMESYALILLEMCKDHDVCELDITDIVHQVVG